MVQPKDFFDIKKPGIKRRDQSFVEELKIF